MPLILLPPYNALTSGADNGGTDPYFASVQALLRMDSSAWTDVKGHTFTLQGANTYSTTQKKFGTGSMFANNTSNSYLQSAVSQDFNIGSGDFTAEMWFYSNNFNLGGTQTELIGFYPTTGTGWTSQVYSMYLWGANNTITSWAGSPSNDQVSAAHGMVINTWYHIAVTRAGSKVTVFVNGSPVITTTVASIPNQAMCMRIGSGTLNGYIDEVRFTKGVARYTEAFIPPTAAFPVGVNSVLFNGSTDYVQFPYRSAYDFGAADWTIECFAQFNSAAGDQSLMCFGNGGGGQTPYLWLMYNGTTLQLQEATATAGTQASFSTSAWTATVGTWYHIACVRYNNVITMYVNGQAMGSKAFSGTQLGGMNAVVGALRYSNQGYSRPFNGLITNMRVSKTAVYTGAFTRPTSALTALPTTVLLTCMSNPIADLSAQAAPATIGGSAAVDYRVPF